MPNVQELYEYLNAKFPTAYSSEWDNDGLMVCDDPKREVIRVLCTLDVTEEAVDHAIANNFDVIVSHHPLIFKPISGINHYDPKAKRALKCIKNGISVMSFHTRLDAVPGGLNDIFAKLLGLTDIETVEVNGEAICRIGNLEYAKSASEFAAFAKKELKAERILYAESGDVVKRVAVCGGDGKDFVKAVKAAGADSYITGQLSYNIMTEAAEIGLNLFEAGHFHTEDFVCSYLTLLILKGFTQVQTAYFSSNLIKVV